MARDGHALSGMRTVPSQYSQLGTIGPIQVHVAELWV